VLLYLPRELIDTVVGDVVFYFGHDFLNYGLVLIRLGYLLHYEVNYCYSHALNCLIEALSLRINIQNL